MEAALKPAAPSAVTVVITSCNQGALIREAVESALAEFGAPGRDGTAPAGQFAPVLENHPYINSRPSHLQDGTIHLLGARLKMSIVVKPKAVIS